MTYTRQDLRLICELIELEIAEIDFWEGEEKVREQINAILHKNLFLRPTEEELNGVINAVKGAYTPDDDNNCWMQETCETCKNIGGRNAHPGGKKGNLCFLLEHYCKISNRKTYPSSKACKNYEKED